MPQVFTNNEPPKTEVFVQETETAASTDQWLGPCCSDVKMG